MELKWYWRINRQKLFRKFVEISCNNLFIYNFTKFGKILLMVMKVCLKFCEWHFNNTTRRQAIHFECYMRSRFVVSIFTARFKIFTIYYWQIYNKIQPCFLPSACCKCWWLIAYTQRSVSWTTSFLPITIRASEYLRTNT